ncbi:MAG: 3D domain-containing protein [Psychrobacillus sp.]
MKKRIIAIVVSFGLTTTSVGWAMSYDTNQELKKVVTNKIELIDKQSTKIANLENVIVEKDEKLDAEKQVIEKQKRQLQEKEDKIAEKEKEVSNLKNELKKEKAKVNFNSSEKGSDDIRELDINASGYIGMCVEGCSGRTRSGYDVTNTIYYNGMRIIATDTSFIPMYSIVEIEGFSEKFIALDTGGYIKGNKIDILFSNTEEARKFGRKNLKLRVIRNGK